MIAALLLTAASVAQLPSDLSLPIDLERSTLELSVQASDTHFTAQSYSSAPLVVVFGAPDSDLSTSIRIAPGTSATYTFCRGCLDDLYFEVLSLRKGQWSNTGALAFADVFASAQRAIWIQLGGGTSIGWIDQASHLENAQPKESLLPSTLFSVHPELSDFRKLSQAMHVPVVTPDNDKGRSKPPVIEPTPLPPV